MFGKRILFQKNIPEWKLINQQHMKSIKRIKCFQAKS